MSYIGKGVEVVTFNTATTLDVAGNITVGGTVDGRDVATDGTKLDTIAENAIANLSEDTTPQLGGNLDLNTSNVIGTGNINVTGSITGTSFVSTGDMSFTNNSKAIFGTSPSLEIYHDGSNSILDDVGAGNFKMQLAGADKLEITSTGVDVTGGLTTTGNVGIGGIPTRLLHIRDDDSFSGGSRIVAALSPSITNTQSAGLALGTYADDDYWKQGIFWTRTDSYGVGDLHFANRGTVDTTTVSAADAKMTITSSGSVGIGTSSVTSGFKLEVAGGDVRFGDAYNDDAVEIGWSSGGSQGFVQAYDRGAGAFRNLNLNNAVTIDSLGNVGIGTGSPHSGSKLHILAANTAQLRLDSSGTATGDGSFIRLMKGGTDIAYIGVAGTIMGSTSNDTMFYAEGANNMRFSTNGAERMRILSTGDVAFGNTVANTASGYSNQPGGGYVASDSHFEFATTANRAAVEIGKNQGTSGDLVTFRQQGTTVGSIGYGSGALGIGQGTGNLGFFDATIVPMGNTSGSASDGVIDLGIAGRRFKNLYLSGGVVFGATGGAVTSKTLDDYEEGIWYPVLKASTTNPTYTAGNATGYYVKIGNMVYVTWYSGVLDITNSGSGGAQIGNLPFTAASGSQEYWLFNYQHGTGIAGTNTSGGYVERNNNNLIFIQQGTVTNSTWAQVTGRYVMVSAAYRTA
jgi:hypothetical protein